MNDCSMCSEKAERKVKIHDSDSGKLTGVMHVCRPCLGKFVYMDTGEPNDG